MNLDGFSVGSAVLHDVPAAAEGGQLTLTDAPIALDDQLRAYFRRKIIKSLELRGLEVVVDPDADPCVRDAVTALLGDDSRLVEVSQGVGRHLDAVQTGRNSAGLLAVVLGEIDGARCVSLLKLEREQGLRFAMDVDQQGRTVVDLELLRELTLTDKTKVFKTSLFRLGSSGDSATMVGRVSDDQRGRGDGEGVAAFFLSTFLGCQLATSPEKATLDFVRATQAFINDGVQSPEKKGRYQVALLAKMQDELSDVRPRDFANASLDQPDRAPFVERVREAGFDPDITFQKDTSLIKVGGFKITFRNGMVLVGRREDLEQRVEIRPDDAMQPGAEVNDTIKRLEGR